jgi:hypothetical protein
MLNFNTQISTQYLAIEAPVGTVSLTTEDNRCAGCLVAGCSAVPVSQLPYCVQSQNSSSSSQNCTVSDAASVTKLSEHSVYFGMGVVEKNEVRGCPQVANATGLCLRPWEQTRPVTLLFVANIQDYVLFIDHSIHAPALNISLGSRVINGKVYVGGSDLLCSKFNGTNVAGNSIPALNAPCLVDALQNAAGVDIFRLSTLMTLGGAVHHAFTTHILNTHFSCQGSTPSPFFWPQKVYL